MGHRFNRKRSVHLGPEAIISSVSASDPAAVAATAHALDSGGVVIVPTDTVYGIAARVDKPEAIHRIFKVKGRSPSMPLPVLVGSLDDALTLGHFNEEAIEYVRARWPGRLTAVVPRTERSAAFQLGEELSSIGLRVPDDPFVLTVLATSGPLAATSANVTGEQTPVELRAIVEIFGESIDLYVDGGVLDATPSEVVSFIGEKRKLR